jgi:hypothetical protein
MVHISSGGKGLAYENEDRGSRLQRISGVRCIMRVRPEYQCHSEKWLDCRYMDDILDGVEASQNSDPVAREIRQVLLGVEVQYQIWRRYQQIFCYLFPPCARVRSAGIQRMPY